MKCNSLAIYFTNLALLLH